MKPSHYNFTFKGSSNDDSILVYNSLTNGLAELDGVCIGMLHDDTIEGLVGAEKDATLAVLKEGGFIVEDDTDIQFGLTIEFDGP